MLGGLAYAPQMALLPFGETGFPLEQSQASGDDADHVADLVAHLVRHEHHDIEALGACRFHLLSIHGGNIAREQHDPSIRLTRRGNFHDLIIGEPMTLQSPFDE